MNIKRRIPSVNLRERELPSGKIQLYLDITIDGKRTRESLNLLLEKPTSRVIREKNKDIRAIAMSMAEKRRKEEIDKANGVETAQDGFYTRFFEYFSECADKHEGNTKKNWESTLFHLKIYEQNENITLLRINKEWLEGLKKYLTEDALCYRFDRYKNEAFPIKGRRITDWTAHMHYCRVVTCLNWAVRDGLIQNNPCLRTDGVKFNEDNERQYLTKEELKKLMETPMPSLKIVRDVDNTQLAARAIMFSIMTGLRMSDVKQVAWPMIQETTDGRKRVILRQQKTSTLIYVDLNSKAAEQLGERTDSEGPIFDISDQCLNKYLKRWVEAAGINKHITFHCCRHTFATLTLQAGVDLYTTSKLLGHTNISTTQRYAKIVDEMKQQAVDKLNSFID